jgi:hypothetical protein
VLYPLSYGDGVPPGEIGGAEGDRTLDLRIANATLSQLSYRPTTRAAILASAIRDVQWSFVVRVSTRTHSINQPQDAGTSERRDAYHVQSVVLFLRHRSDLDTTQFLDELRHVISVAHEQDRFSIVSSRQAARHRTNVATRDHNRSFAETVSERCDHLLRMACITYVDGIDAPHPSLFTKHFSEPLCALLAIGRKRWVINSASLLLNRAHEHHHSGRGRAINDESHDERKNDRQQSEPDGCEKRAAVTGYGGSFHLTMIASRYTTTANNQPN